MNELVYCIIRRKKNIYASLFYGIQIIKEIETLGNHPTLKTNKWDNALIGIPCDTAVDFRTRLRFSRAVAPARSHLFRFSRRSPRLALQPTARGHYIHETTFTLTIKKSERI
jgi:hypothetical protein